MSMIRDAIAIPILLMAFGLLWLGNLIGSKRLRDACDEGLSETIDQFTKQ